MDLGTIVNLGDPGGIRTATTGNSRVTGMDVPPVSQIRRSTKQRPETSSGPRRHPQRTPSTKRRKGLTDEQRARGGAQPSTRLNTAPARKGATSSRHRRHRQPQSPTGDRPLVARTPPRQARSAPKPPSSPAKDLLRRAQRSVATATDASGRRPFIMDVILGSRPVVSEYSDDVILEAIELSRDALRPTAGPPDPAHAPSRALRRGARSANSGTASLMDGTPLRAKESGYRMSAERSTVDWTPDEDDTSPQQLSPQAQVHSPSGAPPQHMQ
ncbi:hypothetical protein C2E23DRAFT_299979 [Lenzites betulinus]|nr:hypothetical protein C2E23DRAFT_299979 [Lenzites betulinus]